LIECIPFEEPGYRYKEKFEVRLKGTLFTNQKLRISKMSTKKLCEEDAELPKKVARTSNKEPIVIHLTPFHQAFSKSAFLVAYPLPKNSCNLDFEVTKSEDSTEVRTNLSVI
jgi:hypothetical protein